MHANHALCRAYGLCRAYALTSAACCKEQAHARWLSTIGWAAGFWGDGCEEAFFDVRVFNPFAALYRTLSVPALYRRHEREKQARYEEPVREVERAAYTPLVFSAAGGASKLTTTFLKRLAPLLAE